METLQIRAAEYMRMSTEHQQYSIANQSAAIQEYANAHSIEIVRTFVDRGKSGLALAGRRGLKDLLHTVESGDADFSVLLVYDVSRWGRFQDVDESAYHEFSLKRAGVSVIYCAEPFRDVGSPLNALLKTLKRTMAAEYSRELSVKVSAGQRRIAALGYRVTGAAGFGLRRMVFDPVGSRQTVLARGEHKSVQTDRVTLVHGPMEEVRVVRKVFDMFVGGLTESTIARHLTERRIMTQSGHPWSKTTIRAMLTNPKYVGDMVFSRTTAKLASAPTNNPPDQWVTVPDQFEPIVAREVFNRTKEIFRRRLEGADPDHMLAQLRLLLAKHGRLSGPLIDAEKGMMSVPTYQRRFGSLTEAYRRIGWAGGNHYRRGSLRPRLRALQMELERAITVKLADVADSFCKDGSVPRWNANGELSIWASVVRSSRAERTRRVWTLYPNAKRDADLVVLARFDDRADKIVDYFVFLGGFITPIRVMEEGPRALELHRFPDLSFLDTVCRRGSAEGVLSAS